MNDRLLSDTKAKKVILEKHCSPETTESDIIITDVERTLLRAQDTKSYPLGVEDGKALGRAEAFAKFTEPCEHGGGWKGKMKKDCLNCWGELRDWGIG